MKYPGDIIYFLIYIGPDVMIVSIVVLIIIIAAIWYFLRKKKLKAPTPETGS